MRMWTTILCALLAAPHSIAGSLTPPGAPAPTMKTLDEVEPRIPIGPLTTPGDADSVYRITRPGSYYLTGEVLGKSGFFGIQIEASDVSIDLMGFTIRGGTGTLSGIFSNRTNLQVRNGVVRDWDGWGVDFSQGFNCVASGMLVANNGAGGVFLGQHGIIERCIARNNGGDGLTVSDSGLIVECTAQVNGGYGIAAGSGSLIRSSRASGGGSSGILVNNGVAEGCVAENNAIDGIFAFDSIVRNCNVSYNSENGVRALDNTSVLDCSATGNGLNGIIVDNYCAVMRNACSRNGAAGVGAGVATTGSRNRIEGNTAVLGDIGFDINGVNNFVARNTATDAVSNYKVSAGNICLVVNAAAAGVISGNSGGVSPGSTDPNANYAR